MAPKFAFNNMGQGLRPFEGVVFPAREYPTDPELPFSIQFVSPRAVRLRLRTGPEVQPDREELMLVAEPGRDGVVASRDDRRRPSLHGPGGIGDHHRAALARRAA